MSGGEVVRGVEVEGMPAEDSTGFVGEPRPHGKFDGCQGCSQKASKFDVVLDDCADFRERGARVVVVLASFRIVLELPRVAGETVVVEVVKKGGRVGAIDVKPAIMEERDELRRFFEWLHRDSLQKELAPPISGSFSTLALEGHC